MTTVAQLHVVITGSSAGIGRALTERLLGRGHRVWGLARSDQSEFAASHPEFRASQTDVANWHEMSRAAEQVAAMWPQVDAVVTCAAIHGAIGPALEADVTNWTAALRTNLEGTFHTIRAFAPHLRRALRRAKVVCFSGGGAGTGRANFSAYAAAKTGVVRLVETIAIEEGSGRLDINAIAPGAIATRLTDEIIASGAKSAGEKEVDAARRAKLVGDAGMQRALDLVEWLLSPASDGISGKLLSAAWDSWATMGDHRGELATSDVYTLRRITPPAPIR